MHSAALAAGFAVKFAEGKGVRTPITHSFDAFSVLNFALPICSVIWLTSIRMMVSTARINCFLSLKPALFIIAAKKTRETIDVSEHEEWKDVKVTTTE